MTNTNAKGLTKAQVLKLLDIIDVKISINNYKGDDWENALSEGVHEDILIKELLDLCEDDDYNDYNDDNDNEED